jgi:uncharacterized protein (TIGR02145 family)
MGWARGKWRLPTLEEFEAFHDVEPEVVEGAVESSLPDGTGIVTVGRSGMSRFFPTSGYRLYSGGSLTRVGEYGGYWSGTSATATMAYNLFYPNSFSVNPSNFGNKQYGFTVRCVAE